MYLYITCISYYVYIYNHVLFCPYIFCKPSLSKRFWWRPDRCQFHHEFHESFIWFLWILLNLLVWKTKIVSSCQFEAWNHGGAGTCAASRTCWDLNPTHHNGWCNSTPRPQNTDVVCLCKPFDSDPSWGVPNLDSHIRFTSNLGLHGFGAFHGARDLVFHMVVIMG